MTREIERSTTPAGGGGLPEIWAYGLRNPWRFLFERGGSRFFVGDVGQDSFEEIDLLESGKNYCWSVMEGLHCFNPSTGCDMTGLTLPIAEYAHTEGEAVMGGYVYKGAAISGLPGAYVFGRLHQRHDVETHRISAGYVDAKHAALHGPQHQFLRTGHGWRNLHRRLQRQRAEAHATVKAPSPA